jgi:TonB family protein
MLKINKIFLCCFVSIFVHILFFFFVVIYIKKRPIYHFTPMDVTFYSTDQNIEEPSSLPPAEENFVGNTEDIDDIKEVTKEDIKEQVEESEKTKNDVVVKKKKEQSNKLKDTKVKDTGENKNKKKEIDKNKNKTEDKNKNKEENNKTKTESVQKISDKPSGPNEVGTSPKLKSESPSNGNGSLYMGASLDTDNFKYPYYISQVRKKVAAQWRWTESYGNLRVLIYFKISRDGSVTNISVKESSGNEDYNRNALDTIHRASPFAELPEGYEGDSLGVFFEFKF